MTITFNNTDLTYTFYINGDFPLTDTLDFYSHYSNTTLFSAPCTVIQSNSRFTQLEFTLPSIIGANHVQGLYQYITYAGGLDDKLNPELLQENKYFDSECLSMNIGLAILFGFLFMLIMD